ncbi:MAG: hypothetical protein KUL83_03675 [Lentimicrobium sp.]|nr:hypothetical protein [Lentimicrobium sp.]
MLYKLKSTLFLLFFSVAFVCTGYGQDQIILNSGDTLTGRITRETKNLLYFRHNIKGITSDAKVEKSTVLKWTYHNVPDQGPDENDVPPIAMTTRNDRDQGVFPSFPAGERFRGSISGGLGYLLGDTDEAEKSLTGQGVPAEDAKNYYNELVLGYSGTASLHYRVSREYWIGAHYLGFYSKANMTTYFDDGGMYRFYGDIGERYFVNFTGLSLSSAVWLGRKKQWAYHAAYSVGPAFYRNETEVMHQQVLFKGVTLGQNLSLGLEYFITPKISVSTDFSLFRATLRKVKITTEGGTQEVDLDKESYENLSRADLTAGFVFYF